MRILLLALCLAVTAGCAKPSIMVMKKEPGNSTEAARLRKVAVVPFSGRDGDKFTTELETMIAGIRIDDRQFFEIVNRSRLNAVIDEQKLSTSGAVSPETVVNIGRLVGARGIYTGDVVESNINTTHYRAERTKCVKSGNSDCGKTRTYTVGCTKKDAVVKINPKLIDVETGRIVYSESYQGSETSSKCEDSKSSLTGDAEMKNAARVKILQSIRRDIAPHNTPVKISLSDRTDGIADKKLVERFEGALDFAAGNRIDRACEIWGELAAAGGDSVGLQHNLGVCAEIDGRLDEALSCLVKADRLTTSPDELVSESLRRIKADIARQNKLKAQNAD